jgi:hypothetical protein
MAAPRPQVPKAALDVAMESEDPKTALAELLAGAGASGGR